MVRVISCNVNGLRKMMTRRTIFNEIKNLKIDIACLQETFITHDVANDFRKQWDGELIFTPGTTHSLGNIILISKKFHISNLNILHSTDRIICIQFKHSDEEYLCCMVYYPNTTEGKIEIHKEIQTLLNIHANNTLNILIMGDFNCILNKELDNLGGNPHPNREIVAFNKLMNECELYDIWRLHNHESRDFTWRHKSQPILRRIDYILGNEKIVEKCVHSNIVDMPLTDHRAVIVDLQTQNVEMGPGYWKFNNSLLSDIEYVETINELIRSTLNEVNELNRHAIWERCKTVIKQKSMEYAKLKAKQKRDEIKYTRRKTPRIFFSNVKKPK